MKFIPFQINIPYATIPHMFFEVCKRTFYRITDFTFLFVLFLLFFGEYLIGLPMETTAMKLAFLIFDFIAMLLVGAGFYVLLMVARIVDSL